MKSNSTINFNYIFNKIHNFYQLFNHALHLLLLRCVWFWLKSNFFVKVDEMCGWKVVDPWNVWLRLIVDFDFNFLQNLKWYQTSLKIFKKKKNLIFNKIKWISNLFRFSCVLYKDIYVLSNHNKKEQKEDYFSSNSLKYF